MPLITINWDYSRRLFIAALSGTLLLMASGLFLGNIGIDDELNALSTAFDSTGRGMWAHQLITILLPGQLGVSFAPMALGCAIYALSITILIYLWGPIKPSIGYISAAIIGSFPYFASMMTFDVAQVAYPLGFLLITASMIPIFQYRNPVLLALSALLFAIGFACYQGVATTVATGWASIAGMRYLQAVDRSSYLRNVLPGILLRTGITTIIGGLIYLLSVKASQAIIPHTAWSGGYEVQASFGLFDPQRWQQLADNGMAMLTGRTGDAPLSASVLLLIGIAALFLRLILAASPELPIRLVVAPVFLITVLVLPFWLLFVQSMPLTPRSSVGLGVLYGYVFAGLATNANRRVVASLTGLAALIMVGFIFTGNQMYFSQYLANQAEQVTISRVAARLDSVAEKNQLTVPLEVTFIGRYAPAGRKYAKYDTIGASPMDWDNGNIYRQAALFELYGVDGILISRDEALRQEIANHIKSQKIPAWPDPDSVFVYKKSTLVVNFGGI